MKLKLWKQYLLANYAMKLYERLHSLKQRGMFVEECTLEFNNLSIRASIDETNKQMRSILQA